ncbi:MAG: metal-binding protein [Leptolyngbya sp. SIO3F4]|nr:metal-binding protein [Leptolyngbya sp. SIO3F4]
MASSNSKGSHGRVVLNHSTHVPGLIALLHKLATHAQIKTLTPGVISRSRSNAPQLRLKVSVPIRGGFKLIARKGKSVQEVFVITDLSAEQMTAVVDAVM